MIVVRSPLRITLGGGATDLASYYRSFGGFVLSAAIDKYVYITVHRAFVDKFILKYSEVEYVESRDDVKHPLIREALRLVGIERPFLEITSMADIPAGTGLGSSGSFTTALLKALHCSKQDLVSPARLAEEACRIEIDILGEPVGKQDQYISALGGMTCFDFQRNDEVHACSLPLARDILYDLEDNLLLFFTGFNRRAAVTLKEQDEKSKQHNQGMLDDLHFAKQLGFDSKAALEAGDLAGFAELMNVHWERKKNRSRHMSNPQIDAWYDLGRKNGALGGKLVGAGGGGFLMFYAEDRARLRRTMREAGLAEIRFHFDFEGTKVLINS